MRASSNNIFNAMVELTNANVGKTVSWDNMKNAVTEKGVKIKNWMLVRNVLQCMINEGLVLRTKDVHVEEFDCLAMADFV